jgi:hypothetical protein
MRIMQTIQYGSIPLLNRGTQTKIAASCGNKEGCSSIPPL